MKNYISYRYSVVTPEEKKEKTTRFSRPLCELEALRFVNAENIACKRYYNSGLEFFYYLEEEDAIYETLD